MDQHERTKQLLGERFEVVRDAKIAVLGLGGVGGFALEALARSGVGELFICDYDKISASNLNRQLIADIDHLGMSKVLCWEARLQKIAPDVTVQSLEQRLTADFVHQFNFKDFDVVLDCLDTVSVKIALAIESQRQGFKLLSSGGMAKRQNPEELVFGDIYETSYDPMFRVMRRELRKADVKALEVLYSKEAVDPEIKARSQKGTLPSMIFVPGCAGLRLAHRALSLL